MTSKISSDASGAIRRFAGFVMAGFPPEEHIAVVYRVRDGLIHDVILLM